MGACCGKLPEVAEFLQSFEAPPTRCLGAPKSEQLIFVMPEKFLSLSGQDAPIEDKSGSTLAILDGKNLSLRDRAVLMDADRKPIACIREKLFYDADGFLEKVWFFVDSFVPYLEGQKPTNETQNGHAAALCVGQGGLIR